MQNTPQIFSYAHITAACAKRINSAEHVTRFMKDARAHIVLGYTHTRALKITRRRRRRWLFRDERRLRCQE